MNFIRYVFFQNNNNRFYHKEINNVRYIFNNFSNEEQCFQNMQIQSAKCLQSAEEEILKIARLGAETGTPASATPSFWYCVTMPSEP